jgi:hypothetical protein
MPIFFLLLAVFILAVGLGLWQHHLGAACLTAVAFFTFVWILANYAISIDWHDADGFTDWWPRCSAQQKAIQAIFWFAPVFAGVLLLIAPVSALIHARRSLENRIILSTSLITLFICVTIAAFMMG